MLYVRTGGEMAAVGKLLPPADLFGVWNVDVPSSAGTHEEASILQIVVQLPNGQWVASNAIDVDTRR
jgi:hypothetical protein